VCIFSIIVSIIVIHVTYAIASGRPPMPYGGVYVSYIGVVSVDN
jgi:hypothetical protein